MSANSLFRINIVANKFNWQRIWQWTRKSINILFVQHVDEQISCMLGSVLTAVSRNICYCVQFVHRVACYLNTDDLTASLSRVFVVAKRQYVFPCWNCNRHIFRCLFQYLRNSRSTKQKFQIKVYFNVCKALKHFLHISVNQFCKVFILYYKFLFGKRFALHKITKPNLLHSVIGTIFAHGRFPISRAYGTNKRRNFFHGWWVIIFRNCNWIGFLR